MHSHNSASSHERLGKTRQGETGGPQSPLPEQKECGRMESGSEGTLNSRVSLNDCSTRFRSFAKLRFMIQLPPKVMLFNVGYATAEPEITRVIHTTHRQKQPNSVVVLTT